MVYLSLILNALIVLTTTGIVINEFIPHDEAKPPISKYTFRFFTTDSNILSAISALVVIIFDLQALSVGVVQLPKWAFLLKYVGTVSVTVTFVTVLVFLAPSQGFKAMFGGTGFYMHLIGPVLAVLSLCLSENVYPLSFVQAMLGLLPTLIYGIIYLILVVVVGEEKGGWPDLYGFNRTGKWPISFFMMVAGTFLICALFGSVL